MLFLAKNSRLLVISSMLIICLSSLGCSKGKKVASSAPTDSVEVEVKGVQASQVLVSASGWCRVKSSQQFSSQILVRRTFGADGRYSLAVQRMEKGRGPSFLGRTSGSWSSDKSERHLMMTEEVLRGAAHPVLFNGSGNISGEWLGFYEKESKLYFKWKVYGKTQVHYACLKNGEQESVATVLGRRGVSEFSRQYTVVHKNKVLAELATGRKQPALLFKKPVRIIFDRLVRGGRGGRVKVLSAVFQDGVHKSRFKEGGRRAVYDPMGFICNINVRAKHIETAEIKGKEGLILPAGTAFNIKKVRNQPQRVELILRNPSYSVVKSLTCVPYMTVGALTQRVFAGRAQVVNFR